MTNDYLYCHICQSCSSSWLFCHHHHCHIIRQSFHNQAVIFKCSFWLLAYTSSLHYITFSSKHKMKERLKQLMNSFLNGKSRISIIACLFWTHFNLLILVAFYEVIFIICKHEHYLLFLSFHLLLLITIIYDILPHQPALHQGFLVDSLYFMIFYFYIAIFLVITRL